MAGLLSLPENLIVQHLLPLLDHNDIIRLRRVSKDAKTIANSYLWSTTPGHQGKWTLKIDPNEERHSLQDFLRAGQPPPPSRLCITVIIRNDAISCGSFIEDLEEFMERYSKYVTHLEVDVFRFPLTTKKEMKFCGSLVNLESLRAHKFQTVGGTAHFEEKTRYAEGGFLIRPPFNKLKSLYVGSTDCMDSMWNFINGVSKNLEKISHPFQIRRRNIGGGDHDSDDSDDGDDIDNLPLITNLAPVEAFMRRCGGDGSKNLLYDWGPLNHVNLQPSEILSLFALCRDNGIMIKNLGADLLRFILHNGSRWTGENYRENMFVRNLIHSLVDLHDNLFLMECPALVTLKIWGGTASARLRFWEGHGYPEWPNLRKLEVKVNSSRAEGLLHFLCGCPKVKRVKLEELNLGWCEGDNGLGIDKLSLPDPEGLVISCANLRRLTLKGCQGDDKFFWGLWEGLLLLEEVYLIDCPKLGHAGFVGEGGRGSVPIFLKLEKLKRLGIHNLKGRTGISNATFKNVFRHLKLCKFDMCSDEPVRSITLNGIKKLLTGPFGETIEKLDLTGLRLKGVCDEGLRQVVASFRSFKML